MVCYWANIPNNDSFILNLHDYDSRAKLDRISVWEVGTGRIHSRKTSTWKATSKG